MSDENLMQFGDEQFELGERLTKQLVQVKEKEIAVKIASVPRDSDIKSGDDKKAPMKVCDAVLLTDAIVDGKLHAAKGDEVLLIVNAVMSSTFDKFGDSLVGRFFLLRPSEIKQGKRGKYLQVTIIELKPKAAAPAKGAGKK